jgi:hypothetical protein
MQSYSFFPHPDHGVRPLPDLDPRRANRPGPQRILSFVSDYLSCNLEVRSAENPYEILTTRVHISKPTDDKGKQLETEKHLKWIASLQKEQCSYIRTGRDQLSVMLVQVG